MHGHAQPSSFLFTHYSQVQHFALSRLGLVVRDINLASALDQPRNPIRDEAWRGHNTAVACVLVHVAKIGLVGGKKRKKALCLWGASILPRGQQFKKSRSGERRTIICIPASFAASQLANAMLGHHLSFLVLLDHTIPPSSNCAMAADGESALVYAVAATSPLGVTRPPTLLHFLCFDFAIPPEVKESRHREQIATPQTAAHPPPCRANIYERTMVRSWGFGVSALGMLALSPSCTFGRHLLLDKVREISKVFGAPSCSGELAGRGCCREASHTWDHCNCSGVAGAFEWVFCLTLDSPPLGHHCQC